jgi:glycosyltransferase involved in cell wall biosynthesis
MKGPIVQVIADPERLGGAERVAHHERVYLESTGHEVTVLSAGPGGDWNVTPLLSRMQGGGLRRFARHVGDVRDPGTKRSAAAALLASSPSLVHVHIFQALGLDVVRAIPAEVPVVWTFHDYGAICPRNTLTTKSGTDCGPHIVCALRRKLVEPTLRSRVTRFISPSRSLLDRHLEDFPWLSERSVVLRNPIAAPAADFRRRSGTARERGLSVGFLGKRTRDKGFDLAVDLLKDPAVARLVVAGPGARLPDDSGRVLDCGAVQAEDLDRIFWNEVDVLVTPSRWPENAPLVVAEALARGVPVIAAARGGIPEMLDVPGGVAGALLDDWTATSASAALAGLCRPADYERASQRARKAGESFELERHGRDLVALYGDAWTAHRNR